MIESGLAFGRGSGDFKDCFRTRFISNGWMLFERLRWFRCDEAVTDVDDQRFDQILTVTWETILLEEEEEDFQTHLLFFLCRILVVLL